MNQSELLIENIERLHTTQMGVERIKRNLKLDTDDVVGYCKELILNKNCRITRQGKNRYCRTGSTMITVNSYSYTIITAHIIEENTEKKMKLSAATAICSKKAKLPSLSARNVRIGASAGDA